MHGTSCSAFQPSSPRVGSRLKHQNMKPNGVSSLSPRLSPACFGKLRAISMKSDWESESFALSTSTELATWAARGLVAAGVCAISVAAYPLVLDYIINSRPLDLAAVLGVAKTGVTLLGCGVALVAKAFFSCVALLYATVLGYAAVYRLPTPWFILFSPPSLALLGWLAWRKIMSGERCHATRASSSVSSSSSSS